MPLDGRQLCLMLCVKCGSPALPDTFFEMSISEFCVESAVQPKCFQNPSIDFCNYVKNAELLKMLFIC